MKFLFLGGGPSNALPHELRQLGHEVLSNSATDWYRAAINHVPPSTYGDRAMAEIMRFEPDVLVLNKGWAGWEGRSTWWSVPGGFLQRARDRVKRSVYLCYDDPAATPVSIQLGLPQGFDLWLTTCPGIPKLFPHLWPRIRAKVHEFWLAWDTRTQFPENWDLALQRHACDLAVTGTPYHRPFAAPHYQGGFAGPRRDLVFAALKEKLTVGLYGPKTWLIRRHGGDPRLAPHYRGWVDPKQIHTVHRAATVVLGTHLVQGNRYDSGRLPWTLGARGCLLHEIRPGLREEFGNMVAWYKPGDVGDFSAKLKHLLARPDIQLSMRTRGEAHVLKRHCWSHRAKRLVALVGL